MMRDKMRDAMQDGLMGQQDQRHSSVQTRAVFPGRLSIKQKRRLQSNHLQNNHLQNNHLQNNYLQHTPFQNERIIDLHSLNERTNDGRRQTRQLRLRLQRNGQTALEFLILTGFMLAVFTLFFFIIKERSSLATQQSQQRDIVMVADIIHQEVLIAQQVHDGYNRTFELPATISNEPYSARFVTPSEVVVNVVGGDEREYVLFLQSNVTVLGTGKKGKLVAGSNIISKVNGNISITPVY